MLVGLLELDGSVAHRVSDPTCAFKILRLVATNVPEPGGSVLRGSTESLKCHETDASHIYGASGYDSRRLQP